MQNNLPITLGKDALLEKARQVFNNLDVAKSSRDDYQARIGFFLDFIQEQGMGYNTFLDFKRMIAEKNEWSVSTKNKYLITARIFVKELNRLGVLPTDVTQNVKSFSQDKKHKRDGLNDVEVDRVAETLRQLPGTPINTRLKALVCLLTFQGLRQVEITRLDVVDIDFISKRAFIRGKGRDDKEPIDLHPATVNALKDYLKQNKLADGALFISSSNNSQKCRLTTRGLRMIVKDFLSTLEIDKSIHGFRHYFTTTLVKEFKGNLLEVSSYTRHRSLEMLQVYYDRVRHESDLPQYYQAFSKVQL
jgi:integrase/recombinase XerC